MSTESRKLRNIGIVEIVLTLFLLSFWGYFIIGLNVRKSLDSPTVFMFIGVLACLILKLALMIFIVRKTNNVKDPSAIVGGLGVLIIIGVFWLAAMLFMAFLTGSDVAILHLICAVTDVIMLRKLIVSYSKNPLSVSTDGALSASAYGDNVPTQQQEESADK